MQTTFSTESLRKTLGFIFKDPNWIGKTLIYLGIGFASFLLPIVPALITSGYSYRLMRRIIVDGEEPSLPEWTEWGTLIKEGLRLFGVTIIYTFPAWIFAAVGMVTYFGMTFVTTFTAEKLTDTTGLLFGLLGSMFLMFLCMGISMIFTLVELIFMPAVLGHTVAKGSFKAGFDFQGWWKVFRANLGGFIAAMILLLGLYTLVMLISYLFYFSIVLICLMFVVMLVGGVYMGLVIPAFWAQVYRESQNRVSTEE